MGCKNCGAEFDYCQCPPGGAWEDPNSPAICDDCGWPLKRESQEFYGCNAKPAALTADMLGEAMKLLDVAWRIASAENPKPDKISCLWCGGTIYPNDHVPDCRFVALKARYDRLLGSADSK